jgi:hypothetical protein
MSLDDLREYARMPRPLGRGASLISDILIHKKWVEKIPILYPQKSPLLTEKYYSSIRIGINVA